jgi:hypothetical protein
MWRALFAQATGPLAPPAPANPTPPGVPPAVPGAESSNPGVLVWLVAFFLVAGILFLVCMPSRKS